MLSFFRYLRSRISDHARHDERAVRPTKALIAQMMQSDVNNLDSLARGLAERRR